MMEPGSFLQELEQAVSRGSAESRLRALWHATDLLIAGRYSEDEIWIFGEVIGRLADGIEVAARAQLSKRLVRTDNASINIVKKLAFDNSIEVAGPMLQHSARLDAKTLLLNIRTKSQSHLLAISKRSSLPVVITDELVTRGNQEVMKSVATNSGASLSDFGFLRMIKRSEVDSILAEQLGLRKDIPRHLFQQLIAKASDEVRRKLEWERPELVNQIQTTVIDVTGALQSKFGPASISYFNAKNLVAARHHRGELNENSILEYARSRKFEETAIGLTLLSSLPVDVVERALIDSRHEMVLILAKALNFEWETTMSILFLSAKDHRISALELDRKRVDFSRLNTETSRTVLSFYKSRKKAARPEPEQRQPSELRI
jgi:uncharacterized protein (DUF2336 family)